MKAPAQILFLRPDNIGDLILFLPVLASVHRKWPDCRLTLVTRPHLRRLAPVLPVAVDWITVSIDPYSERPSRDLLVQRELIHRLGGLQPDIVVASAFEKTWLEPAVAALFPSARTIRFSYDGVAKDMTNAFRTEFSCDPDSVFTETIPCDRNLPEFEKNRLLASALTGGIESRHLPELTVPDSLRQQALSFLASNDIEPGRFIACVPGGTANIPIKAWPIPAFVDTLGPLAGETGFRILLLGNAAEESRLDEISAALRKKGTPCRAWKGRQGELPFLAALLQQSAVYIGNDTGPMHMAAATGRPTLGIFGGGHWPRFQPAARQSAVVVQPLPCFGCDWTCRFGTAPCLGLIPPETVLDAARRLLALGDENGSIEVSYSGELDKHGGFDAFARHHSNRLVGEWSEKEAILQKQIREIDSLKTTLDQKERQIARLEDDLREAQRRSIPVQIGHRIANPLKNLAIRLLHAYLRRTDRPTPDALPRISVVTPVLNGEAHLRETILSVITQGYPNLEYIIVDGCSTDGTMRIVEEYRSHLTAVISEPDHGLYDAVAKGFEKATGEILAYLNADDCFHAGALERVGRHFFDHSDHPVIYHENSVDIQGWRFQNVAQPHVGPNHLLRKHILFQDGVFFTRKAYEAVGGINRNMKLAGDWDLWNRLIDRFPFHRVRGHPTNFRVRENQLSRDMDGYWKEVDTARSAFLESDTFPRRLRRRLRGFLPAAKNLYGILILRRRLFFPIPWKGMPPPPAKTPAFVPREPRCPITGHCADELIFSSIDNRFGDDRLHYLFLCRESGTVLTYPPMKPGELLALHRQHYSNPPPPPRDNPASSGPLYGGFPGSGPSDRLLRRLRYPPALRKRLKVTWDDTTADELLYLIRSWYAVDDDTVRFLDVGCFEGGLLDALKEKTNWALCGLEPNAEAARKARTGGHHVINGTADDAPYLFSEDRGFDLIFLGQTIEHFPKPVAALKRLSLLLSPNGSLVVSTPNLGSRQIDLFGPTWAHWHVPFHRVLYSPEALRLLGETAGLETVRLRSFSHPYWSALSLQLHRAGSGAVIPHGRETPLEFREAAENLAATSRLFWNWKLQGDYVYAHFRR